MSTSDTFIKKPQVGKPFVCPDPPEREPGDMTRFDQISITGTAHYLAEQMVNPGTTLVGDEHYVSPLPTGDMTRLRYTDLFVAFGVDPAAYYASNAYIISEQAKPQDLVLGITSARTGRIVPHDDLFRMARTARFKGLNMEGGSG